MPAILFGCVIGCRIVLLETSGKCVMPRVIAGRFVVVGGTFPVLVECQVLSMARFSLKKEKKEISY